MLDLDHRHTVLVVDDDESIRQILASILNDLVIVEFATSGKEALEKIGETKLDLIFLEVEIPDMDGYEVCRRLKANDQTSDIPVVFITASNSQEYEEYGFDIGATDFIRKPFSTKIVRARASNILKLSKAAKQILEKEKQMRMIIESMPGSITVVDQELNIVLVNSKYKQYFGDPDGLATAGTPIRAIFESEFDRDLLLGEGTREEIVNQRLASFRSNDKTIYEDQSLDGDSLRVIRKPLPNGHTITVTVDITDLKQTEAALQVSEQLLQKQVLELKYSEDLLKTQAAELITLAEGLEAAKQKMQHLANHDALTGLPSLRLCRDRLERAMAVDQRDKSQTAVLFIDLDGFKAVNDSMGHKAGDEVLKGVAKRLKSLIRGVDTAARIGGDEFILILPKVGDKNAIARIAQKIIDKISEPFSVDEGVVLIGASIGIAVSPADGATPDKLLRNADKPMYAIKKGGKNNYGFFA